MLVVSRRVQDTMTLLILGLLFGYATSAIVSILLQFTLNAVTALIGTPVVTWVILKNLSRHEQSKLF